MKKIVFLGLVLVLALGSAIYYFVNKPFAPAEPEVFRVGVLINRDDKEVIFQSCKDQLAEWGYQEGKNISYQVHNAKGDRRKTQEFAEALVAAKLDLILTTATSATVPFRALIEGTDQKVVFLSSGNPLKVVDSYLSPGRNITGVASGEGLAVEKRIGLLKKLRPEAKNAVVLLNPNGVNYKRDLKVYQNALPKLGLTYQVFPVSTIGEVETALQQVSGERFSLLLHGADNFLLETALPLVIPHTLKERILTISTDVDAVRQGMLLSYDSPDSNNGRQAARIVKKVLEGHSPATIPVEMPGHYFLYLNLRTAKAIGLSVPPEILRQADKLFE